MPLFDLTHKLLEQALVGSSARQRALSANLANANTPGYRRVDVDFESTLRQAVEDGGVDALDADGGSEFAPVAETSGPTRYDGSSIDVERETAALSENALTYQALVQVARSRLKMLETAMGGSQ